MCTEALRHPGKVGGVGWTRSGCVGMYGTDPGFCTVKGRLYFLRVHLRPLLRVASRAFEHIPSSLRSYLLQLLQGDAIKGKWKLEFSTEERYKAIILAWLPCDTSRRAACNNSRWKVAKEACAETFDEPCPFPSPPTLFIIYYLYYSIHGICVTHHNRTLQNRVKLVEWLTSKTTSA